VHRQAPSQPELQVHLTHAGPPFSPEMTEAINARSTTRHERSRHGGRRLPEDYEELTAKAWSSCRNRRATVGVEAVCRDNSGNWMVLVEQREYTRLTSTA